MMTLIANITIKLACIVLVWLVIFWVVDSVIDLWRTLRCSSSGTSSGGKISGYTITVGDQSLSESAQMKDRMLVVARRGKTRAIACFIAPATPHFAKMIEARVTIQQGAHTVCMNVAALTPPIRLKENKKGELVGDIEGLLARLRVCQRQNSFALLVL